MLVDDAFLADISDDDSVSLVLREGSEFRQNEQDFGKSLEHYWHHQVFNLKTGEVSTSLAELGHASATYFLSPNSKSLASAVNSRLSLWDLSSS